MIGKCDEDIQDDRRADGTDPTGGVVIGKCDEDILVVRSSPQAFLRLAGEEDSPPFGQGHGVMGLAPGPLLAGVEGSFIVTALPGDGRLGEE